MAASTCTKTWMDLSNNVVRLKYAITASTSNAGGVTSVTLTEPEKRRIFGWYLFQVISDPGATSPTAAWDFTIKDDLTVDLLGGVGADRSATASELVIPKLDGTNYKDVIIEGGLTLAVTGNSVSGALIDIYVYFRRNPA